MAIRSKSIRNEFYAPRRPEDEPIWEVFHAKSKLLPHRKWQLGERIARLQAEGLVKEMAGAYKSYPNKPQIELPTAKLGTGASIQELITRRRSRRAFDTNQALTAQTIGNILQLSYGITGVLGESGGVTQYARAVPSAGALYPLELYVMIQRVDGVAPGIYHYRVAHHALEALSIGDQAPLFARTEPDWGMSATAAANLVITAVFERSTVKYGERGYRFALMEAGMLGQNASLVAAYEGIDTCMMGGFLDDEFNAVLGLDGISESVLLPICLGKSSSIRARDE